MLLPYAKSVAVQQPEEKSSLAEWATLLCHAAWYAWRIGSVADALLRNAIENLPT